MDDISKSGKGHISNKAPGGGGQAGVPMKPAAPGNASPGAGQSQPQKPAASPGASPGARPQAAGQATGGAGRPPLGAQQKPVPPAKTPLLVTLAAIFIIISGGLSITDAVIGVCIKIAAKVGSGIEHIDALGRFILKEVDLALPSLVELFVSLASGVFMVAAGNALLSCKAWAKQALQLFFYISLSYIFMVNIAAIVTAENKSAAMVKQPRAYDRAMGKIVAKNRAEGGGTIMTDEEEHNAVESLMKEEIVGGAIKNMIWYSVLLVGCIVVFKTETMERAAIN